MVRIKEEFKNLIPPLTAEEFNQLEHNILSEGIRDPLIIWNDFIIDGHNRFEIAQKHDLYYQTMSKDFNGEDKAKEWIILNQFGRRNLTKYDRSLLALKLEDMFKSKAKENQGLRTDICQKSDKSITPIDTKKEVAKVAKVSHDTIAKVKTIEAKATPEQKNKIRSGETTINRIYKDIKKEERKQEKEIKKNEFLEKKRIENIENIKVINGDCIEELPKLSDKSIDLIIIDPPYYQITNEDWDNQFDSSAEYLEWSKSWLAESFRILKDNGSFYIFGSVGEKSLIFLDQINLAREIGFIFKDWITWKKKRGLGNRKGWLYTREEVCWFVKSKEYYWDEFEQYSDEKNEFKEGFDGHDVNEYKRISNVWADIPEQLANKNTFHYTPKPIKLLERIIKVHSKVGDTVLDFFAGSGSTGKASNNLNRISILIEQNKEYCEAMNFND